MGNFPVQKISAFIVMLLFFSEKGFSQNTFPSYGNVGVGTSYPSAKFEIQGDGIMSSTNLIRLIDENSNAIYTAWTAGDSASIISGVFGRRTRGSYLSAERLIGGDRIAGYYGSVYNTGGSFRADSYVNTAAMEMEAAANHEINSLPTFIRFSTTPENSIVRLERMRITENGEVGIGIQNPHSKFHVNGSILSNRIFVTADERYKADIIQIDSALNKVNSMNGVSFSYSNSDPEMEFMAGRSLGFIAQELKEVLPNAVREGENGYYSIDYNAIVPVLAKAIQELDSLNNAKIAVLEENILALEEKLAAMEEEMITKVEGSPTNRTEAVLYQNNPNPFDRVSAISYFLPNEIPQGTIFLYNMNGEQISKFEISGPGKGNIEIDAGTLKAGMYIYALVVGNKVIDSKKLILTK